MSPLADPEFRALLRAALQNVCDRAAAGALADWLRERGLDQLAVLAAAVPDLWPEAFAWAACAASDVEPIMGYLRSQGIAIRWTNVADELRRRAPQ